MAPCFDPNFYSVLDISFKSSSREVKESYRRLALLRHPDKNPGDHTACERFQKLNEAYETLSDENRRILYDAKLKALNARGLGSESSPLDKGNESVLEQWRKAQEERIYQEKEQKAAENIAELKRKVEKYEDAIKEADKSERERVEKEKRQSQGWWAYLTGSLNLETPREEFARKEWLQQNASTYINLQRARNELRRCEADKEEMIRIRKLAKDREAKEKEQKMKETRERMAREAEAKRKENEQKMREQRERMAREEEIRRQETARQEVKERIEKEWKEKQQREAAAKQKEARQAEIRERDLRDQLRQRIEKLNSERERAEAERAKTEPPKQNQGAHNQPPNQRNSTEHRPTNPKKERRAENRRKKPEPIPKVGSTVFKFIIVMTMTNQIPTLTSNYPWTKAPLIISAPTYPVARSRLVSAVTKAGGLGIFAAGISFDSLSAELDIICKTLNHTLGSRQLPIGIGVLNWGANLQAVVGIVRKYTPAVIWFFAPKKAEDLEEWSQSVRLASQGKTAIWVQVGSVAQAVETVKYAKPDVLVVQGSDAGGHGLEKGAGITSLLPEIDSVLHYSVPLVAAGGISDGRGVAAALALGAQGAVLGTRFLASSEAEISKQYQDTILKTNDGGQSTVRTHIFDELRSPNPWPLEFDGRGVANQTYKDYKNGASVKAIQDSQAGSKDDEQAWNSYITNWAGTGVGLVNSVQSASEIISKAREEAVNALERAKKHI